MFMPDYPALPLLTNPLENLLAFGEMAILSSVGMDDLVVGIHLEDTTMTLFKIRRNTEFVPDFGRHPRGQIRKASLNTVRNFDTSRFYGVALIVHGVASLYSSILSPRFVIPVSTTCHMYSLSIGSIDIPPLRDRC
jgi:hypothetical protein